MSVCGFFLVSFLKEIHVETFFFPAVHEILHWLVGFCIANKLKNSCSHQNSDCQMPVGTI